MCLHFNVEMKVRDMLRALPTARPWRRCQYYTILYYNILYCTILFYTMISYDMII